MKYDLIEVPILLILNAFRFPFSDSLFDFSVLICTFLT